MPFRKLCARKDSLRAAEAQSQAEKRCEAWPSAIDNNFGEIGRDMITSTYHSDPRSGVLVLSLFLRTNGKSRIERLKTKVGL